MQNKFRTPVNNFLTYMSLSGIIALFVPFTFNVSPARILFSTDFNSLGLMIPAFPAFLSILITLFSLQLIISGRLNRFEIYTTFFLSLVTAAGSLFYIFKNPPSLDDSQGWLSFVCFLVSYIAGIYVIIKIRQKDKLSVFLPIMTMQFLYMAHAILFLISFFGGPFGGWQIGAYFTLFTVVVYLTSIVYYLRFSSKSLPAASFKALM